PPPPPPPPRGGPGGGGSPPPGGRAPPPPPGGTRAGPAAAGRPGVAGRLLCLLSWRSKKGGRPPGRNPGQQHVKRRNAAQQGLNPRRANEPATFASGIQSLSLADTPGLVSLPVGGENALHT
ncbi:MAG: hypothetical protein E6R15_00840, partial [Zoogloea sp.]